MARWMVTDIFKNYQLKKPTQPVPSAIWHNPLYFIAFGFGAGAIPFAPGTFGTLIGIPFYLVLSKLPLTFYLLTLIIIIIASSIISDRVSKEIHIHDHPGMCLDEIVGFLVTMTHAPAGWIWIVIGFLLFRLFDIWKPWPIRTLDQEVEGGFGMILDDVVAGLYAMIIIQILEIIFTTWH